MEITLEMLFFTFSNANMKFTKKELNWKTYTTKDALSTNLRVELIDKKEFAETLLNENVKSFVVHIAPFTSKMTSYPAQKLKSCWRWPKRLMS